MQKNTKQTTNHTKIIVILTAVVAIAALLLSAYALIRISNDEYTREATNGPIVQLQTEAFRIRFCHDNQIIPCDDAPIKKWGSEHPNESFNL